MRKSHCIGIALTVAAMAVLAAVPALAGDYHTGTQLICSDCHTMHFSVSHLWNGDPGSTLTGLTGPNPRLLKGNSANQLCLSCHDGQTTAPDVLNANTGIYTREAGALNLLTGNTGGYATYMGHTLDFDMSVTPPPGWDSSLTPQSAFGPLECIDCHSAHGGNSANNVDVFGNLGFSPWRNLTRRAGSGGNLTVSYAAVTNDATRDVYEVDPTLGQVPTHYSIDNVSLNEPVSTRSGVGEWCKKCHTNFHGTDTNAQSANMFDPTADAWLRHPTAGADIGTRWASSGPNHVKVMKAPGAADTTATPTCTSCHKAHGNRNPFGLIYMPGNGAAITEEGDGTVNSTVRDLCRQCHNQGA